MTSDVPDEGAEGPPSYERLLPGKLKRLLDLTGKTPEQFCDEMTRNHQIHERATVLGWMVPERLHFPNLTNQQKIVDYFRRQLGVQTITTEWLRCPMAEFEALVARLIEERKVKNLTVPVARKLGEIRERHIKALSGKYVLYRYSMRYPEHLVSEIFTLKQSDETGYFDMHLRSSPEEDEKFEDFRGRFFRYGPMYWAILTFCVYLDDKKIDLMRVVQFPQVERTRGIYMGLMMADANTPTQAVAVRCFAYRIDPDAPPITDQDNAQIWIGQRPRGDAAPLVKIETIKKILSSGLKEDLPPYAGTFHLEDDLKPLFPPDS